MRRRIENDIKPNIGKMKAEDVKPRDIDGKCFKKIVKRGAPTMATDVLRWTKRIFDFAIKRHVVVMFNPASAFDPSDAGGKAGSLANPRGNHSTVPSHEGNAWGLLGENLHRAPSSLVGSSQEELIAAPWSEFDLENAVWRLPAERTKTNVAIDIPLPPLALETLKDSTDWRMVGAVSSRRENVSIGWCHILI